MKLHFETARLEFREFCLDDLDGMHSYSCDLEVVRYQAWGPNTLEQTRAFLGLVLAEQSDPNRYAYNLAVIEKSSGRLLGGVSAIREPGSEVAIGFSLRRIAWGKGFGSECARGLVTFTREKFKTDRIDATCDARNVASQRILEKAGFKVVNVVRNHIVLRDGTRDTVFMEWSR